MAEAPARLTFSVSKPGTLADIPRPRVTGGIQSAVATTSTDGQKRFTYSAYSGGIGRRLRSLGDPRLFGSPPKRLTKIVSGPNSSKNVTMPLRKPVSSDETVTTVVMPITIPRMVSPERNLLVHTEETAMCTLSAGLILMLLGAPFYSAISATTGSRRAACRAGYQPEMMPTPAETNRARNT